MISNSIKRNTGCVHLLLQVPFFWATDENPKYSKSCAAARTKQSKHTALADLANTSQHPRCHAVDFHLDSEQGSSHVKQPAGQRGCKNAWMYSMCIELIMCLTEMFLFPLTLLSKQKTCIDTTKAEGFPPLCARMPRHTAFSPVAFSFHWVNKPEILCERQVEKLEHIFLFWAAAARWALMGCSCTCWWQAQLEHTPVISGTVLHTSAQHAFTYYKTSLKNISVPVNSIFKSSNYRLVLCNG